MVERVLGKNEAASPILAPGSETSPCLITMANPEVDPEFRVIKEYPPTIFGLSAAFIEKRGYDPFFLLGANDEEIAAEADLDDILSGEYTPDDPTYERYCQAVVTEYRKELIRLIEDDAYYQEKFSECPFPGGPLREKGTLRAGINEALKPPEFFDN